MQNIRHEYHSDTETALLALSRETCYFPKCSHRVIRFIEDEPVVDIEMARIREDELGSPRYDATVDRNSSRLFSNLVFLCKAHHTWVDEVHCERFSVEMLEGWKASHERHWELIGDPLSMVTEKELPAALETVIRESFPFRSAVVELGLGLATLDHFIEIEPNGFADFSKSHHDMGNSVAIVHVKNDGLLPVGVEGCSLNLMPLGPSLSASYWSTLFGTRFPFELSGGESGKLLFTLDSVTTLVQLLESQNHKIESIVAEAVLASGERITSSPVSISSLKAPGKNSH